MSFHFGLAKLLHLYSLGSGLVINCSTRLIMSYLAPSCLILYSLGTIVSLQSLVVFLIPETTRTVIVALPFCRVRLRGQKPPDKAYPKEVKTLGDAIRTRRLDLRLRHLELAQLLGCNEMTIVN